MKSKKLVAVMLAALLIAGVGTGAACAAQSSAEASLKDNQRYVYAYITSIAGNEITYMEVEESVVTALLGEEDSESDEADANVEAGASADAGTNTEAGAGIENGANEKANGETAGVENSDVASTGNAGGMPGNGEMPDMGSMPGGGEMPDMGSMPGDGEMPDMSNMPSDGEMPDMSNMPSDGEMPDMSNMPSDGEMPDMSNMPSDGEMPDMSNMPSRGDGSDSDDASGESERNGGGGKRGQDADGMQFGGMESLTTVTTYIPVGVPVYTVTDVKTTFSRLASGDLVKILVETNDAGEEVIEQIWMLQ